MRLLDIGFKAHIESGATTLATCWKITRDDASVLGFTDHDLTLNFGGVDYLPAHGLDASELPQKLGPQVDTSEVLGVLHSDAISEADIDAGLYDGAEVETWRVNWRDVSQRLLLRRATIGEIVREDGAFRAELRSGQRVLNQVRGRIYSVYCDAVLGDARCKVAHDHPNFGLGCDRALATCRDRFDNVVNFRGFPHIPGNDFVLKYPKSGDPLDGAPLFKLTRQQIVIAARAWIGTPYRHQAATLGAGCDCLGLLRGVWRQLHDEEPMALPNYRADWRDARHADELLAAAGRLLMQTEGQPKAGQVVLFRLGAAALPKHCGIIVSDARFVHAQEGLGVFEANLTDGWRRRVAALFEFPGVVS